MKRELSIDGRELSVSEKAVEQAISDIKEVQRDGFKEFDDYIPEKHRATPGEPPAFVGLSEQLADSLVQSCQMLENMAAQKLEEAKLFADQLRSEIKKRKAELEDLKVRLETFGQSVLEAHKRFHNGAEPHNDLEDPR